MNIPPAKDLSYVAQELCLDRVDIETLLYYHEDYYSGESPLEFLDMWLEQGKITREAYLAMDMQLLDSVINEAFALGSVLECIDYDSIWEHQYRLFGYVVSDKEHRCPLDYSIDEYLGLLREWGVIDDTSTVDELGFAKFVSEMFIEGRTNVPVG